MKPWYNVRMSQTLARTAKTKNTAIRREVISVVREIFTDPDFGRVISPAFMRRLRKSKKSSDAGLGEDLKKYLARMS